VGQAQQRAAVGTVEAVQQRQVVVAVVGGQRLVLGHQVGQAAVSLDRLQHCPAGLVPPPHPRPRVGRGPGRQVDVLGCTEQVAEHREHALVALALLGADGLQQLAGLVVHGVHPLAQHGHQVVAGAYLGLVQQARLQHDPLDLAVVAHLGGVQRPRLRREMGDLGGWNALQPGVAGPGHAVQPGQMV
jgi:hypothetical protein